VDGIDGAHFTATACDNGEPGKGSDTFSISLDNGYENSAIPATNQA